MALDPTPWVVAGGAQHSADLARALAFASTGGAEGVVLPDSMKVSSLGTPGAGIQVAPGAAVLLNRSPGAAEQSYVARNASATTAPVATTGSGAGRSDLVVLRVKDPQYPPWPAPANPATAQYTEIFVVQGVPSGTTRASDLNLGYPAIALARLDIPASSSTITNAMIVDVRKVARPRRERMMFTAYPSVSDYLGPQAGGGVMTNWPSNSTWQIDVPDWATVAVVHGTIAGAQAGSTDPAKNGDLNLQLAVLLGSAQTQAAQSEWLTLVSGTTRVYPRSDLQTGGTLDVSSMRGQRHTLRFRGAIVGAADATVARMKVDNYSTLLVDVEFQERAI